MEAPHLYLKQVEKLFDATTILALDFREYTIRHTQLAENLATMAKALDASIKTNREEAIHYQEKILGMIDRLDTRLILLERDKNERDTKQTVVIKMLEFILNPKALLLLIVIGSIGLSGLMNHSSARAKQYFKKTTHEFFPRSSETA